MSLPASHVLHPGGVACYDLLWIRVEGQTHTGLAIKLIEVAWCDLNHLDGVDAALPAKACEVGIERHHLSKVASAIRSRVAQFVVERGAGIQDHSLD